MLRLIPEMIRYRELLVALAWRNIAVRYKQSYLGIFWAILKPLMLMLIFMVVRSFVGIDSGDIPYPILTFAALMPWVLFQDATTECVGSVVANSALVKKVYFPREVFPVTAVITRVVELLINFVILAGMMVWFEMVPTIYILWVPVIILYTLFLALAIGLVGSAANVYYRDVRVAMPVFVSLLMYLSPVIYPLSLVRKTLLEDQAAGDWSGFLYHLYTFNPMAGIIDAFQRSLLHGTAPDFSIIWPGLIFTALLLPLGHLFFKRAEVRFADVI